MGRTTPSLDSREGGDNGVIRMRDGKSVEAPQEWGKDKASSSSESKGSESGRSLRKRVTVLDRGCEQWERWILRVT